jgi:16S rRNA (cytosine967-C5)-methyltransferase
MNSMTATARQCAAELLHQVLSEKRPLDEAMARHAGFVALEARDRAFVRLMLMTVLRRLGQIDALLSQMLENPLKGRTQDVMHCLRLGVVQLLWLKTPAHAAVHAMVETVAALGHERMKGLANAVLKRVAKEGSSIVAAQDAVALNIPQWLYASWREAYGEDKARAIAEATLDEPALDITAKHNPEHWAQALKGEVLPTGSVRVRDAGRVEELEGFAEGAWWVQDAAAALPVQMLGDVRGLKVLDLCAAPGGKTAQLAAAGARVTAVDKSPRRLATLCENLQRLKLEAEVIEADIMHYTPAGAFDAVLLDAPCSATGTLRRHPEIMHSRTADDVADLAKAQRRLLARTAGFVAPRGRLLYCVCSLQPEEGLKQAAVFMAAHPGFAVIPAPKAWEGLGIRTPDGALLSHPAALPGEGGMDGFYAICWQRLNHS